MTFGAPFILAALALLLPVAVAFIVRRRRDVLRVPSTLLWRKAGLPVARSRFRKLRRVVSLLACLGGIAALVVAAARPTRRDRGETVAFVVDVSASMDAGGRSSPLARARRFMAARIAAGGPNDRYAIVAAGAAPARLAGPAAPGPELDEGLDALRTERGAADIAAALDLAAALVAGEPGARVVMLGDGGHSANGLLSVRDVPLGQRASTPAARDNLGIAAFATRPLADGRDDEREAMITVATSSERPRAARIALSAEGREIAWGRLDVPAAGEASLRLRVPASVSRLAARVVPDDGVADALASDDEAVIDGAARSAPRAWLVTSDGEDAQASAFFAEKALAAAGIKDITRIPPSLEGAAIGPSDVVVALAEGPAHAIDSPALYLGTKTGVLPFTGVHDLEGPATHLRSLEARDPLLHGVSLDGVTIEHASAITVPSGARALVDLDGGTAVVAGGAGARSFVFVGVDPAKSDLVLRVAFPVLVANAIHTLAGAADVIAADTVARSEIMLRREAADPDAEPEREEPLRASVPFGVVLAMAGAVLLALEAWAFRKGWST